MKSFRNPKYLERYEDVFFELETPLNTGDPGNDNSQKKTGYRFVVDNTGEVTPFDWYNARISMTFKVQTMANANIAAEDHNGIVNGSHSFINNFDVKLNGRKVYDCNDANQAVNIKNLLEYSSVYAQSTATNELFYLDTTRHAEERPAQANYNKGFAARKALLGLSADVTTEITLNHYSFFEALRDELLPSTRMEINLQIESDNNLIWQAGAACRVMIMRMQLVVPRITFNSEGQSLYIDQFMKPHKWTYLRENIERSNSTRLRSGTFTISTGIERPRHVFVFIINDANIGAQTTNPFLYNTFNVANDRALSSAHLVVANGNEYPDVHYNPSTDMTRVYRDVLKYVHANNEHGQGTLLNSSNFKSLFGFLYFDLTKQKADIRDGTTKLVFHYELSGATNANYSIYALTLYEQNAELVQKDGKLLFR